MAKKLQYQRIFNIEDKTFDIGFRYRSYSILKWGASKLVNELFDIEANILYIGPYLEDIRY